MKVAVLFPKIFDHAFTYENHTSEKLFPGDFVKAPFGSTEITGIIWPYEQKTEKNFKLKKISRKINVKSLSPTMIDFILWFSKYNLVPLGMCLKMCLLNKDVVEKSFKMEFEKFTISKKKKNILLTSEQNKSLTFLRSLEHKHSVTVIEGVTGSGKTLVYFERVRDYINKGFQSLIMLPEIALTNQFGKRFTEFFGGEAAIWHSSTTKKNKSIIWKGITEGKIKIIIGARSSLFLPFKNLGIIVVDEEHDASYKQDEGISYNARDMAITRAFIENIPINLVTSVPSVETYNNISNKKYFITKLKKRYKNAALPKIEIINLHSEKLTTGTWIANKTLEGVDKYLNKGDQVLFFVNRRGYAPFVVCKRCGYKFQCPNCAINLNYHKNLNKLLCHYCGHKSLLSRLCKNKKSCDLLFCGPGIERVFDELKKIYPSKKIEIFSSDTLKKKETTDNLLENAVKNKIDILVGTQLLSKGFHFPKLNCIVVVDADFSSHGYDLRAAEKNIQLYHQLSGRAGREGNLSTIYFQTYTPDDEVLINISKNNPYIFLKNELLLRKEKKLPPFYRLISLIISGQSEQLILKFGINIKSKLPKIKEVNVLGPVLAPITKLKRKYRCRILIRYPKKLFIQKYLSQTLNKIKVLPGIKLEVDVDPINFS
ncbi:MAG: primosomal protein N' (replication factor Y) (superfamily II helicase) [Pelagibacterales bacterium]|nr:primosomal protein N' (replication factor Y) (superfamily II helicase) [Pelagibacterales bacterium]